VAWPLDCSEPGVDVDFDTVLSAFVVQMHPVSIKTTKAVRSVSKQGSLAAIKRLRHRAGNCKMVHYF